MPTSRRNSNLPCPSRNRGSGCIHKLRGHPKNSEGKFLHSTGGRGSWVTDPILPPDEVWDRLAEIDKRITSLEFSLDDRNKRVENCQDQIDRLVKERDEYASQVLQIDAELKEERAKREETARSAENK